MAMDDGQQNGQWFVVHRPDIGGSGWESNPPRPATRPATGVEDQEAHRDLTTPAYKHNLPNAVSQVILISY